MATEERLVRLVNTLFEEAVRRRGCDLKSVLRDVKAEIAGLSVADRAELDGAFERLMASAGPRTPGGWLH